MHHSPSKVSCFRYTRIEPSYIYILRDPSAFTSVPRLLAHTATLGGSPSRNRLVCHVFDTDDRE